MKPALLIADDDEELLDLFRKFLPKHGYVVEVVSSGLECLAKLRQSAPDVLVLGLDLPWGGGEGVLAWLREQQGETLLPSVVLIAGGTSPGSLTELAVPPVVCCLRKPFSLAALLESIRSAMH